MNINSEIAQRVLDTVDAGLSSGLGQPTPGSMCVEAAVCYALGLPHKDDPGCVAPSLRRLKINLNDLPWSSNAARASGLRRLALVQLGSLGALDEAEFAMRLAGLCIRKIVPAALESAVSVHPGAKHRAALRAAAARCKESGKDGAADAAYAAADAARAAAYTAYTAYTAYAADAAARAAYAADAARAAACAAYAADAAADAARAAADAARVAADAARVAAYAAYDKTLSDFAEDVVQILVEMNVPGAQWLTLT